jgi:putative flippase GtrA
VTFIKANISSLTASFFDFLTTIVLANAFSMQNAWASAIGTTVGGIINFLIGRYWAFESKADKIEHQAWKYMLVWTGNLLLNTGGVHVLTEPLKLPLGPSKIFVSLFVAVTYNYVLQKKFVFKK